MQEKGRGNDGLWKSLREKVPPAFPQTLEIERPISTFPPPRRLRICSIKIQSQKGQPSLPFSILQAHPSIGKDYRHSCIPGEWDHRSASHLRCKRGKHARADSMEEVMRLPANRRFLNRLIAHRLRTTTLSPIHDALALCGQVRWTGRRNGSFRSESVRLRSGSWRWS